MKIDTAAALKNDIPYVPIRFITEQLEGLVEWDKASNSVVVMSWYYLDYEENEESEGEEIALEKFSSAELVNMFDESVVMIMTNRGSGSGVVIGEDLILTNYHVIEDGTSATISTIYEDEIKVKGVVVANEEADLAIIRTEEPLDLLAVEFGYDYEARKGDRVYAIGSPQGLQNTVSTGLISNMAYEQGISYIQTNAQIDHGSSGGALFNEYGQLVGITTSGYDNSVADLNFAVSSYHAAMLFETITEENVNKAKFLTPSLPVTLVGAPLNDVQKLMKEEFSAVPTSDGEAKLTDWEVKRDSDGWLVFNANIDPVFYLYYGASSAAEMRLWSVNLSHELHAMLPDEKIQVVISFQRDYDFQPRNLKQEEVSSLGNNKWRVRYPVINIQFKDQLYIQTRI